jgi:tetratricopeptide (TPR) repeat protein
VTLTGTIVHGLGGNLAVATERTCRAAGGFVTMERMELRRLPGVAVGSDLFEVRSLNRGRSRWHLRAERQLSPFIGRDMQLQILNRAWRDTREGDGQTLFVVADPGLGKSRLAHEFVGAIPDREAECLEAGALETDLKAGLVVIRRLLQGLFDIEVTETPGTAVEKVRRAQGARGFDRRLVDPLLAAMDLPAADPVWGAMSAAERSRRVREAVVALLLSLAAARPIVLLVEDLHWMDAESEAILVRLAEALQAGRILMILTCRPEYDRSAFSGARSAEIRLSAFNAVETDELLDHLLGIDPELGLVRERLSEACRGNALFLEETVRSLADTGRLLGSPGRYRAAGDPGEIEATANIHSIVAARLERLDPHARRLAEVASIFGGEIPAALLRRMVALPGEGFEEALRSLKRADLLVEVQVFPESFLRFKHALIRNSITGRIVAAARAELHRAALAELESYYSDRTEEHVEQFARHAIEGQLWQAAVGHLLSSAWKAIRRSAHSSALAHLDSGIRLLAAHPEISDRDRREIEFQLARGVALMAARGWGSAEVLAAFERAEALCETIGDDTRLFSTLRGRAQYYMISGQPAAAQELAQRCARIVEGTADPGLLIETDHMFWTNSFFLGDVGAARRHAERTIGCYDAERDHRLTYLYSGHDPGVCSRCFAGLAAWLGGDPDAASRFSAAAVELAEQLGHPLSTALAYWGQSHLHVLAGQPEQALEWGIRELSLAEQFQFPLLVGQALCQSGWARFWLGRHSAGLAEMEKGMDTIRATGAEMGLPYFIGLHAEALWQVGRSEEARISVAEAIRLGQQNGTLLQFAELLGIEARIEGRLGAAPAEIEKKLRRARDMAQSQLSAMGELRLATELAGWLRRQGRDREARELIAPHAGLIGKLTGFRDGEAARDFL